MRAGIAQHDTGDGISVFEAFHVIGCAPTVVCPLPPALCTSPAAL